MNSQKQRRKLFELPSSRKDLVAEALRESILTGERPAGSRINLDEVAADLGVSRMPVREALTQLEAEGLVINYPHRGVEVSKLNVADMEEIFSINCMLEQGAAERAIPRLTDAELEDMRVTLERMDQISGRGKLWIELNRRFHRTINSATGWPRLASMLERIDANVERYVRAYVEMAGYDLPQKQHWALYRACRDRKIERAKAIIADHIRDTADRLITELEKLEDPGTKSVSVDQIDKRAQHPRAIVGVSSKKKWTAGRTAQRPLDEQRASSRFKPG